MIKIRNNIFLENLLVDNFIPKKLNEVSLKYRDLLINDIKIKKIKTEDVKKCLCNSINLEQLTKIDRFGLPFGSLICKDCGLVVTSPRISQESLPYYYDKYYHPLNYGKEHLENQNSLFVDGQGKKIFYILKDFLPQKEKISVLEIGAGTGSVLYEFKEEAKKENIDVEELGTEYSQDCIDKCKENKINTIFGNIQTVLELNKKFDVIILSHVFEHFIDLNKELENIRKLMSEETLLYIEVPGIKVNHKKGYYEYSYLIYHVHAHMYNFTFDTLNYIMNNNFFENLFSTEEVETVYRLTSNIKKIDNSSEYRQILEYLYFLYENQPYLNNIYKDKIFYEKQFNQQKQTIQNREQTIKGKEYLLEKKEQVINKHQESIEKYLEIIQNLEETIKGKEYLLEKKELLIENQKILIGKQSKTIENREKTIKGKIYKLSKIENYLYLLLNSIEEITKKPIFQNPFEKYKLYKHMLRTFDEIKGYLKK